MKVKITKSISKKPASAAQLAARAKFKISRSKRKGY